MTKTIGILGCGWLGFPLAKQFIERGYEVHGSTTSEEKLSLLSSAAIKPFLIRLGEEEIKGPLNGFLKDVDTLIINVPPKLRGKEKENYVQKMQLLYKAVKDAGIRELVFVSSTSVYGGITGIVTEETVPEPVTDSGRQLLQSEALFTGDKSLKTIIIRFGGLIGPDRHPVYRLSGKKGLTNGSDAVNLIHLNDCIHLIETVITKAHWNEIFNGVYPKHPQKKEYYSREASIRNLPLPEYKETSSQITGKIIKCKAFLNKEYAFFTSILS